VDARKLKVKDKVVVSPAFALSPQMPGTFRMMMHPTTTSDRKGGASFRKAKGKGNVSVKCESSVEEMHHGHLSVSIQVRSPQDGSVEISAEEAMRGPVIHNFAYSGICSLPKDEAEWDFAKATDEDTQQFVVVLRVASSVI